jgi:hypothetical protein
MQPPSLPPSLPPPLLLVEIVPLSPLEVPEPEVEFVGPEVVPGREVVPGVPVLPAPGPTCTVPPHPPAGTANKRAVSDATESNPRTRIRLAQDRK